MTRRLRVGALCLLLAGPGAAPAAAEAPELVSYQGVLTLSDGRTVPNGNFDLVFRIFEAPAAGTALYEKSLTVGVASGLYNVLLSEPDEGVPLTEAFASGSLRYMEVEVETGPPAEGVSYPFTLWPRQQIASVPYALSAGEAQGGGEALGSHVSVADEQNCVAGSWSPITNLAATVTPPAAGYEVSSDVVVSAGGGTANYFIGIRLKENGLVVAGPTGQNVRSGTPASLALHYLNTAASASTPLAYTVESYCQDGSIVLQPNYSSLGQTESTLSIEVRRR
jgi:hypothetical protein